MARIPEEAIQEVKRAADVVEVVRGYVPDLKRSGQGFKALCPFHQEKTPSFHVNPEKQIYRCFGCGKGGDVFKFVEEMEHVGFGEAVRLLAERFAVPLPDERRGEGDERATLYRVNQLAAEFFRERLLSRQGAAVREYLKKRGISEGSAERFGLGYAPEAWDALVRHLGAKGVPVAAIEKLGLAIPRRERTGHYDRFRSRLVFPIHDAQGRAIAFGARALASDQHPKYLNSPEGPLFQKGKNLYALHLFRGAARREAIGVVEGYTDVIVAHQHGFDWMVATLGTAFTKDHARLMKRYADRVVVLYDADEAGEKAALRSTDILVDEDLEVRVATLPHAGHDPADFLLAYGAEPFARALEGAKDLLDYKIDAVAADAASPDARARAIEALLASVARVPSPIKRSLYRKRVTERLGVDEATLQGRLAELRRKEGARPPAAEVAEAPVGPPPPVERELAEALLQRPDLARVAIEAGVEPERFRHPHARAIAAACIALARANVGPAPYDASDALRALPEAARALAAELLSVAPGKDYEKTLREILARREALQGGYDRRRRELKERMAEALRAGRQGEYDRLAHELLALEREKQGKKVTTGIEQA